ncbi:3161_t:CDS:2, partial [Cetraspora pellucida]
GNCAENTAKNYDISREAQDMHASESYRRAAEAWKSGVFKAEVVPVTIKDRKKDRIVDEDEEYKNVKFDKIPELKPVFEPNSGTVTAANSSTINDGASALVLMTRVKAEELGVKPLARILFEPIDFPIAPSHSLPIALKKAGLEISDISLFEFNEAFSVVIRANEKILGLDPGKVNIAGGAVALGHPIGSSGSRIIVTLTHLLKSGQIGAASICNGGGGA